MALWYTRKLNFEALRSPTLLEAARTPMRTIGHIHVSKAEQEHSREICEKILDELRGVPHQQRKKNIPEYKPEFSKRTYLIPKTRRQRW